MGSLLITPFSCTLKPKLQINMKVFATLATVLGASAAAPVNQMHSSNMRMDQHSMKSPMGLSMESQMSQHGMSDMQMGMNRHMSNMMGQDMRSNVRDMYKNNQDMISNMMRSNMIGQEMSHNMMGQDMRSNMRDMQNQAFGPNQYFKKDDFGNYVYSYNDQQSEKSEEGNDQFTKGQYAYIMSNGVKRKVEYIADDNGFHIIKDNADPARIKRSSEPDLLQTKMTSVIDSSSLRDDGRNMYRMSTMRGRDMSSQMDRNMMVRNMMGQDTMGRNMLGQDNMGRNMMDRNIYSIMSNRGMTSDMSNMMGQQMDSNMMGQDMTMDVIRRNMIDRNNMIAHQEITPNMMYSNMIGQDMTNTQMASNMMNSHGRMDSRSDNGLMGQSMMQKMEIERVPETYMSTRFF